MSEFFEGLKQGLEEAIEFEKRSKTHTRKKAGTIFLRILYIICRKKHDKQVSSLAV